MYISDRIKHILQEYNLSPSAFADRIGVQRSNISHILSGRNKPGLDLLEKIITNFPEVNAYWLISGEIKSDKDKEDDPEVKTKTVVKIIHYYADNTFEEFLPKKL